MKPSSRLSAYLSPSAKLDRRGGTAEVIDFRFFYDGRPECFCIVFKSEYYPMRLRQYTTCRIVRDGERDFYLLFFSPTNLIKAIYNFTPLAADLVGLPKRDCAASVDLLYRFPSLYSNSVEVTSEITF